MPGNTPFTLPGLLMVITLASGIWLSRLGRPYRAVLFNSHKLMALGAVVIFGIQIYHPLLSSGLEPRSWALVALMLLIIVALFASGALLNATDRARSAMLTVHRVGPAVLLVAAASLAWMITRASG